MPNMLVTGQPLPEKPVSYCAAKNFKQNKKPWYITWGYPLSPTNSGVR